MNQLLDTILDKVNKQVDHAEIYMERNESVDVDILNDKVISASSTDTYELKLFIPKSSSLTDYYANYKIKVEGYTP